MPRSTVRGPGSNQYADKPPLPPSEATSVAPDVSRYVPWDSIQDELVAQRSPLDNPFDARRMDHHHLIDVHDVTVPVQDYLDGLVRGRKLDREAGYVLLGPPGSGRNSSLRLALEDFHDKLVIREAAGLSNAELTDLTQELHRLSLSPVAKLVKSASVSVKGMSLNLRETADPVGSLFTAAKRAAKRQKKPLVLVMRNLPSETEEDRALVTRLFSQLHEVGRSLGDDQGRIGLVGYGSPALRRLTENRDYEVASLQTGKLTDEQARKMLLGPVSYTSEDVFSPDGVDVLVEMADGNPAALHRYARTAWNDSFEGQPIDAAAARAAAAKADADRAPAYEMRWEQMHADDCLALLTLAASSRPRSAEELARLDVFGGDVSRAKAAVGRLKASGDVVGASGRYGTVAHSGVEMFDAGFGRWMLAESQQATATADHASQQHRPAGLLARLLTRR